jgi:hypothetical protein
LVAALTDCRAVVIVLAEDVACVAAVFSFAAAFVTLVAADETTRDVAAVPAAEDLVMPPLAALVLLVLRVAVTVAGFAELAPPAALVVRALAALAAVGLVGTDLPPSGSVTVTLLPRNVTSHTSRRSKPIGRYTSAAGRSPPTARIASSTDAPRPTATPMR